MQTYFYLSEISFYKANCVLSHGICAILYYYPFLVLYNFQTREHFYVVSLPFHHLLIICYFTDINLTFLSTCCCCDTHLFSVVIRFKSSTKFQHQVINLEELKFSQFANNKCFHPVLLRMVVSK